jgi:hypothetical protein
VHRATAAERLGLRERLFDTSPSCSTAFTAVPPEYRCSFLGLAATCYTVIDKSGW